MSKYSYEVIEAENASTGLPQWILKVEIRSSTGHVLEHRYSIHDSKREAAWIGSRIVKYFDENKQSRKANND